MPKLGSNKEYQMERMVSAVLILAVSSTLLSLSFYGLNVRDELLSEQREYWRADESQSDLPELAKAAVHTAVDSLAIASRRCICPCPSAQAYGRA
jgi:hypothetical protein